MCHPYITAPLSLPRTVTMDQREPLNNNDDDADNGPMVTLVVQLPGRDGLVVLQVPVGLLEGFLTFLRLLSVVPRGPADPPPQPIPESMLVEHAPQQGDKCSICLEEVTESPSGEEDAAAPWVSLSLCHHRFHRHCIRQSMDDRCPLCRTVHKEDA